MRLSRTNEPTPTTDAAAQVASPQPPGSISPRRGSLSTAETADNLRAQSNPSRSETASQHSLALALTIQAPPLDGAMRAQTLRRSWVANLSSNFGSRTPSLAHRRWSEWINAQGISPAECAELAKLGIRPGAKVSFVGGEIVINDCLDLSNNRNLTSLPEGLSVGGNLKLYCSAALTSLPERLSVGCNLLLNGCISLLTLPEPLLAWPHRANGCRHDIFLENTGLNTQVRARLEAWARANPNAGIQLHFSQASIGSDHGFATLQDAWTFWQGHLTPPNPDHDASASAASTSVAAQPVALISMEDLGLSSHDEAVLCRYLAALKGTQEAQQQLRYLAGRVANLAQLLASWASAAHPDTRSKVIITLDNAMTSCHDRVITGLDQAEQIQLIEAALHASDNKSLRQLGQHFYKLQIVHEHAQRKVANLTAVDELEVFLKFEIALSQALALPIGTRSMLYEACASCVTQADLDAAEEEATQAANNPEKLNAFLATWAPWQEYERKRQQFSPWDTLATVVPLTLKYQQEECLIEKIPYKEISDPVVLLDNPTYIYSYNALQVWYKLGGKHPIDGSPLDLSYLRRLPSIHTTLHPEAEST